MKTNAYLRPKAAILWICANNTARKGVGEGGRGLQTFPQNMQSEQGWAPYLLRRVFVVGEVQQLAEHAVGAARLLFAQLAVHRQLLVGHAHVLLLSSHQTSH